MMIIKETLIGFVAGGLLLLGAAGCADSNKFSMEYTPKQIVLPNFDEAVDYIIAHSDMTERPPYVPEIVVNDRVLFSVTRMLNTVGTISINNETGRYAIIVSHDAKPSTVFHELVHIMQFFNGRIETCVGILEAEAYRLSNEWIALKGLEETPASEAFIEFQYTRCAKEAA